MSGTAVPLLKFTPSAQNPELLEQITVQREELVADLVDAALDEQGGARHRLIVGPRGMGKSHVLALAAHRIRVADPDVEAVVLAWLDEDPWAIRSYTKLLTHIVAATAEGLGDVGAADAADELRGRTDADEAAEEAEGLLRDLVGQRRLVVIAENLDDIFARIKAPGQERLRALFENWPRALLLASTTQLFAGVSRHTSPFYGFFRTTHLEELTLENATELLRRVATLRDDSELLRFLGTDTARRRLRAIEALAGGHPRIWHLFAGCISIPAIEELVPLFLEALDDLTPYYQDRLRELGNQDQELVILLSEAGGALSNRDLAERSGMSANQVAAALGQLADRAYVRRAVLPEPLRKGDARRTYWELREPLMRLCLDVKQSRGRPLAILVEFLKAWYGVALLDEMAHLPTTAKLASSYAAEAFRRMSGHIDLEELLRGTPAEIVARAERGLALAPSEELLASKAVGLARAGNHRAVDALASQASPTVSARIGSAVLRDDGRTAIPFLLRAVEGEPESSATLIDLGLAYHWTGDNEAAVNWFDQAIAVDPASPHAHGLRGAVLRFADPAAALDSLERAMGHGPERSRWRGYAGVALLELDRPAEALAALDAAVRDEPDVAEFHYSRSEALWKLRRDREALSELDELLLLEPESADAYAARGQVLQSLDDHRAAIEALAKATELDPGVPALHNALAESLIQLGRAEAALHALSRAEQLAPGDPEIAFLKGRSLVALERWDDAVDAMTSAVDADPANARNHFGQGLALQTSGRRDEALASYRRAIELAPGESMYPHSAGWVLSQMNRYPEALTQFDRSLKLNPTDVHTRALRAHALAALDRTEEAIAVLVATVALKPEQAFLHDALAGVLRSAGRLKDAARAAQRATELDPNVASGWYTRAALAIELDDLGGLLAALRKAVAADRSDYASGLPESTVWAVLAALWDAFPNRISADHLHAAAGVYADAGTLEDLGAAMVGVVPDAIQFDSQSRFDAWLSAWEHAGAEYEGLEIALSVMRAATEWKRDGDQRHIVALPPEQREILIDLLEVDG